MDVTFERLDIFPSATHTALNVSKEAKSLFTKLIYLFLKKGVSFPVEGK